MKTLGFLGCGMMAQAILRGLLASGYKPEKLYASNRSQEKLQDFVYETGIRACTNEELIEAAEVLVLAVKPQVLDTLLPDLHRVLQTFQGIVVSLAAGRTLDQLAKLMRAKDAKIVRAIPNTPVLVRQGLTALSANARVSAEDLAEVHALFSPVGDVVDLAESSIDAWSALTSSSPAFVSMFLEGMADGAVQAGLPRGEAYRLAAQAVLGTCALYLDQGGVPGAIKDQVCSPGGSSIAGVQYLEDRAFRGAVMGAIRATVERSKEMSHQAEATRPVGD